MTSSQSTRPAKVTIKAKVKKISVRTGKALSSG